ncbi:MAG: transporter [Acidobacteria bacterium]|nr:transporter [Acidobacteriota bacterium]MBI3426977.1 transporter [Acidobacteriota bacterium]
MKRLLLLCGTLLFPLLALGQEASKKDAKPEASGIQDNSFLIEEAYNQEAGVIQHIHAFSRQRNGSFLYTFTQEWPFFGQKHQLSYTLPSQRVSDPSGNDTGLGDIAFNYRYQLVGSGATRWAVAPRLSLLLPNGSVQKGIGAGGVGYQVNLPVSTLITPQVVMHWNAGMTVTPAAQNLAREQARTLGYNLGHSVIWLAKPSFHAVFETAWNRYSTVAGPRLTEHSDTLFLNPGVRWAHNFRNGTQIVPGISVPLGVGPSNGVQGVFLYLSIEHPLFGKKSKS